MEVWTTMKLRNSASSLCLTTKVCYQLAQKRKRHQLTVHLLGIDDVHFPTLTVDQTIKFALRNKTPSVKPDGVSDKGFVEKMRDEILGSLGILHTKKTLVGNEFVRGVSGGERKRVSLAEVMAGQVC
jgi:ABC-type multidrug transport system ATPase subunit